MHDAAAHPARPIERTGGGRARALHLASRSARRRKLLTEHGIAHEAEAPGVDDSGLVCGGGTAAQWAAALAFLKASAGARRLREAGRGARLVLGADTVVVKDGTILGQPLDAADAGAILRALESGEHLVVSGVALLDTDTGERELFADTARVRVGAIGAARIDAYVASGEWRGKAGGYNLAERIDAGWPVEYEGDPATVMGLPMRRLLRRLERWSIVDAAPARVGERS